MKSKKKKKKKYEPYKPPKMKFFRISDPFGDVPVEVRREIVREAGAKARATFDIEYPKLTDWFDTYEPLYILSFCVFYFMTVERGVDREAVDGTLDFPPHNLELLQAFALMRPRSGTPKPLKDQAQQLKRSLKDLTDALSIAQFEFPTDASETELRKRMVLAQMRGQTFAIRNSAFPEQTLTHLKAMFEGRLSDVIAGHYGGVSITRLIDALAVLAELTNLRITDHRYRLGRMAAAKDFDSVCQEYHSAFPGMLDDREGMRVMFKRLCRGNLLTLKTMLMMHADLRLASIFTFSLDEIVDAYGDTAHRNGIERVLTTWSHQFGDLSGRDPKHFLYSNPVIQKPFIRLRDGSFFWVLGGLFSHTLPSMLELLVAPDDRELYLHTRSRYLEDRVESLCRQSFPDGRIYRGSSWKPSEADPTIYENDVLVVIDSTAVVVECKAHLVDPPARRGAEFRLVDTLEDIVVSASRQAQRFTEFLKANPVVHQFKTRSGHVNEVDASRLLRFVSLSVTYENLGFVSANLTNCVDAGLIESDVPLVPSICLTDLEVILETLDSQAERIHYLSRRAEVEQTVKYLGDEGDLFALYLETGFNLGAWEDGKAFVNIAMKSKEVDPYFMARADGISIRKPTLSLSRWWRDILNRIEEVKKPLWTELALILLNTGRHDQDKFEREVEKLINRIEKDQTRQKHNWELLVTRPDSARCYAVICYPYRTDTREERNDMIGHMAGDLETTTLVQGIAVIGLDMESSSYPYDVLVYIPGHAAGAPEGERLNRALRSASVLGL